MRVSARINLPATGNGVASQVAVHMLQERTPSCRLTVRPTTILRSTTYIPTLLRHYYYYYSRQWQQQLRLDSAMETCTGRTVGFCPTGQLLCQLGKQRNSGTRGSGEIPRTNRSMGRRLTLYRHRGHRQAAGAPDQHERRLRKRGSQTSTEPVSDISVDPSRPE